jgi:hypothetical protein
VLDKTRGNIMAVKTLLGHSSISTTADIYTDWNIDQLADTLREVLDPARSYKNRSTKRYMRLAGIEPATSRSGGARSIP